MENRKRETLSTRLNTLVAALTTFMVDSGLPFSAWNLTRNIRNLVGAGIPINHSDVKTEVENLFNSGKFGSYTRSSVALGAVSYWQYSAPVRSTSNRIRVPAATVKAAGLRPGDTAYVTKVNGGINISKTPVANVKPYKVDRYSNVRCSVS